MTATIIESDVETISMGAFEFAIACEWAEHEQFSDQPAEWVVILVDALPCGCRPAGQCVMSCTICLDTGRKKGVRHGTRIYKFSQVVKRVEPLSPPSGG